MGTKKSSARPVVTHGCQGHAAYVPVQRLATLNRALDRQSEAVLSRRGSMNILETRALAYIEAQQPVTVGDLAGAMFMDFGQTSRIVNALVRRCYLERTTDKSDKRSTLLSLSPEGREAYELMHKRVIAWNDRLFAELEPDEAAAFESAIEKLIGYLSRLA